MATRWWRRLGAGAGLLLIVALGVLVIGGSLAAVLALTIDDTPAAEQEATEAADVVVLRCGQNLTKMTTRLRVTNNSTAPSDYFIDLEFVQRAPGTVLETASAVVEDLAPGASRPVTLESTATAPAHFDCHVGDVDRLSA